MNPPHSIDGFRFHGEFQKIARKEREGFEKNGRISRGPPSSRFVSSPTTITVHAPHV
jgi:hypothetical protein